MVQNPPCNVFLQLRAKLCSFVSLGLNRVWLRAGDVAYGQGEKAGSMYVVISGRLRLVSQRRGGAGGASGKELHVDEEVRTLHARSLLGLY